MAENINLSYPNFTLTPQAGSFGTINTSAPDTILRVKNTSGGLINDYTLSSNMSPDSELVTVEYCGPRNLSGFIDNVTFFTVERIPDFYDGIPYEDGFGNTHYPSKQCIIKRWETNVSFSILNLKDQIIINTTGIYYYDIRGAAVEHYHRTFDFAQPSGQNYLDINSGNRIENGDTLFLGPSSDTDNPGATEKVTVSFVDGDRVYLNGSTLYQYVFGDQITFFKNIYLISRLGPGGDERYGTIFKHDAYSGARLEYTDSGEYARISGARWSTQTDAVATISVHQLLFIRPYDSYQNWRSMFLSNITASNANYFEVHDVIFDEFNLYKLMERATFKDDLGNKTNDVWSNYNYQQDTLLPYTHNVAIYMNQQYTIGQDSTRIYLQARDQFGVGLKDVNINLYHDGSDGAAQFIPLNGQAITDKDGKANIGYVPGGTYTGETLIKVRADKSSAFTGSEYCWNVILIDGKIDYDGGFGDGSFFGITSEFGHVDFKQIFDPFKILKGKHLNFNDKEITEPPVYFNAYSQFGTPGGNWVEDSQNADDEGYCWPWLKKTPPAGDGPEDRYQNFGCEWDCISWQRTPSDPISVPICANSGPLADPQPRVNFITQILEFTQKGVPPRYYLGEGSIDSNENIRPLRIPQPLWFWQYIHDMDCLQGCALEDGRPVPIRAHQYDAVHDLMFSQLKTSRHSFYVDGIYTDTLDANVSLDQFIFVEDAVPAFWSEKNPRETDIWIRLRPFAFSLNGDTLRFYVREVWTVDDQHYDTGYYDVIQKYGWPPNNDKITLEYFDAGGGALGIEFRYDNPDIFHHNALVFVHIEIEDTAAEPNFIYTDYWFRIIPDYKSPYLENENPDREETQVPIDSQIYFEIKDDGEGIDIDTLKVYLNSRIIYHAGFDTNPNTTIEEVSLNHYKVTLDLPYTLQYSKEYSIGVVVSDVSENRNILRDSYRIYTRQSDVPWFTDFDPKLCKKGMPRFRDVSFIVLGGGEGVDRQTLRIQVHNKDVTDKSKITPIIYRVS